jgi:hypothetical protein
MSQAMVDATIISPGEAISAGKSTQVFNKLNDLLESWSLERLMVYAGVLENFSLISGQNEYTYGTGGDFDSARPVKILEGCFVRSGSVDHHVAVKPLNVYRRLRIKESPGFPRFLSFNEDYPLMTVFLFPTPASADTIYLKAWKQLVSFSDKTTEVDLPPGYRRAITLNLAVELCPAFGKVATDELVGLAAQSLRSIRKANSVKPNPLRTDQLADVANGVSRGRYPILSGPWED